MKRIRIPTVAIWTLAILLMFTAAALAKSRIKDWQIAPGDATNPKTISFVTTYGFQPQALCVVAPDGGAMLKFKGVGGRANFWKYVPAGTAFVISRKDDYPVDSLTVLRDATSSSVYTTGFGGE